MRETRNPVYSSKVLSSHAGKLIGNPVYSAERRILQASGSTTPNRDSSRQFRLPFIFNYPLCL